MRRIKTSCRMHVNVNCAECLTARRCWNEPLDSDLDVLVQRQDGLAKGARLVVQGSPFVAIYLVVSGCLRLQETRPDGTERVAGFCMPGELLGLEAWVGQRYAYTAEAAEATTVCRLAWPGTRAVSTKLLQRLLAKAASQLNHAAPPWPALPAAERVATFLTDFAKRARLESSSTADWMRLPMTRAQLGSYLGLAEETVVRAIAQLREEERLDIDGRSIRLSSNLQ